MAKFLTTTAANYHLEELVKSSREKLVLISPFLKVNERLRELLSDLDRMKTLDIRIVYGKNELQPDENNWIRSLASVRTSFCKNLHAKCYLNESWAIITSMNLYEFSQVNNHEMGVLIKKDEEPALYQETYEEAMRLVRISEEIKVSVEKVERDEPNPQKTEADPNRNSSKLVSTTQLAKQLGVSSKDLFSKLAKMNWIERSGDSWVLTPHGKKQGGQVRRSAQYGEFVVWPEDLPIG